MAADAPGQITVIGNGIVGLAVAFALTEAGRAVTVIDRTPVDEGTSTGNAGAIAAAEIIPIATPGLWKRVPGMLLDPLGPLSLRAGYLPKLMPWLIRFLRACRPDAHARGIAALAALLRYSLEDHRTMLDVLGAGHLISGEGTLFVYRSEAGITAAEPEWAARVRHGIEAHRLDRGGLLQHEPALGPAALGGYYVPGWAHYRDPRELLTTLADHLRGRGVVFARVTVADFDCAADGHVRSLVTDDGRRLPVETLVIAAGAWSGRLSRALGEPFPIEADRGYNTTLPAPAVSMRRMVTFAEDNFVATPMAMGLRIGGAVEMGALDAPPDYRRARALVDVARRYLPDLETEGGSQWMGHRPGTPDSLPVISRSRTATNVVYAFGHGHLGLTLSATTGRMVAALVGGRESGLDMAPYRIDRFARGED